MASPIAHSLVGLALGLAWTAPRKGRREALAEPPRRLALLGAAVLLANAPDLDYLPGLLAGSLNEFHQIHTHSVAWALLFALGAFLVWRLFDRDAGWPLLLFFCLLTVSHLALDYVTTDTRPPYGIMLFWPFSDRPFHAPVSLFLGMHKASLGGIFRPINLRPALIETAVCLPLAALAWIFHARSRRSRPPALQDKIIPFRIAN